LNVSLHDFLTINFRMTSSSSEMTNSKSFWERAAPCSALHLHFLCCCKRPRLRIASNSVATSLPLPLSLFLSLLCKHSRLKSRVSGSRPFEIHAWRRRQKEKGLQLISCRSRNEQQLLHSDSRKLWCSIRQNKARPAMPVAATAASALGMYGIERLDSKVECFSYCMPSSYVYFDAKRLYIISNVSSLPSDAIRISSSSMRCPLIPRRSCAFSGC
jgi:hypothetical protein